MLGSRTTQGDTQKNDPNRFLKYLTGNELNLAEQKLAATAIPGIVAFIKNNPQIVKVNLSGNLLKDQAVAELIKGCPKIKSLDLSHNNISAEGTAVIAQHPALIELNLSENLISDSGVMPFVKNTKLICLKLINCGLKGFSIAELANNTTLHQLDVSRNGNLKRRDKNDIATLLEKNTKLTRLTLNGYLLSQQDLVAISKNTQRVQLDKVVTDIVADAVEENEWTPVDVAPESWSMIHAEEVTELKPTIASKDKDWDFVKKKELSKAMKKQSEPTAQSTESYFTAWLPSFSFWSWGAKEPAPAVTMSEKKEEMATKGLNS